MEKYHKINTIYKRDPDNRHKTLLVGQYSLPEFAYLAENQWSFTEKVDGTNIRICWQDGVLTFKGKTDNANIPATLVERLYQAFTPLHDKFVTIFRDAPTCIYGEGYGHKIQKGGGNYRQDQDFVMFDVNVDGWWLQRHDVVDIANKLSREVVPEIGQGTLHEMLGWASRGITSTYGGFQAEGIVARPLTELCTRGGNRIITKIKCRDFEKTN